MDDLAFPEVAHHIRVIGEQGLEVRRGYVEDFLPVRIREQLGGNTARCLFGHGYAGVGFVLDGGFGCSVIGLALGGRFGGGVGGLRVWVVGHGSFTGAVRRCLFCRTPPQRPCPG